MQHGRGCTGNVSLTSAQFCPRKRRPPAGQMSPRNHHSTRVLADGLIWKRCAENLWKTAAVMYGIWKSVPRHPVLVLLKQHHSLPSKSSSPFLSLKQLLDPNFRLLVPLSSFSSTISYQVLGCPLSHSCVTILMRTLLLLTSCLIYYIIIPIFKWIPWCLLHVSAESMHVPLYLHTGAFPGSPWSSHSTKLHN